MGKFYPFNIKDMVVVFFLCLDLNQTFEFQDENYLMPDS